MYALVVGKLPFTTPYTDQYRRQKLLQQIQKGLIQKHDREMSLLSTGSIGKGLLVILALDFFICVISDFNSEIPLQAMAAIAAVRLWTPTYLLPLHTAHAHCAQEVERDRRPQPFDCNCENLAIDCPGRFFSSLIFHIPSKITSPHGSR